MKSRTPLLSTFNEPSPPVQQTPPPTAPIIQVQSSAADALRMAELQRKLEEAEAARKAALAESEAAKAKAAEVEKKLQEQQATAAAQTSVLEQFQKQQEELKARIAAQEAATEAAKVAEYRSKVIAAYLGQGVGIIEAMVQGSTVDEINASAKAAAEEYARIQKMTLERHKIPAATPQGVTTTPSAPAAPSVQAPSAVNPAPVPPEPNPLSAATIAAMSQEEYAKNRAQILQGLKSSGFSPEGHQWGFGYTPLRTAGGPQPLPAPAPTQQAPAPGGGGINHESVLGSVR